MHECPECKSVCVCDCVDTWHESPTNCHHNCENDTQFWEEMFCEENEVSEWRAATK